MLFATGNHDCLDGVVCGCGQWFAECLVLYLSKSSNVFVHFAKKICVPIAKCNLDCPVEVVSGLLSGPCVVSMARGYN